MTGKLSQDLRLAQKFLRIFVSSTFIDTAAERRAILHELIPQLQAFASRAGVVLEVVDLRWGKERKELVRS